MRIRSHPLPAVAGLLLSLVGCSSHPPAAGSAAIAPVGVPAAAVSSEPQRSGRPYDVVPAESLLTILAMRGGTLGRAGHNHVIASHQLNGTLYVPHDLARTSFDIRIPVAELSIDEPQLRANEGPDFPVDVPQSARDGTRHNMLSEALLDADLYPEIRLVGVGLIDSAHAAVQVSIHGQTRTIPVPVTYRIDGNTLTASGELPLKQTDLGLRPFSAMLGALQVQDEMPVRFRLVARAGAVR